MKKENKIEKKLSLKKIQIAKLNFIRGGDGNDDNMTGADTTTSINCDKPTPNNPTPKPPQKPTVVIGNDIY